MQNYEGYRKPLRVVVIDTSFSHPENFVTRNPQKKGQQTHIDDLEGSWMNAGAGGESNTINLDLRVQDAQGTYVRSGVSFPLVARLWYWESGKLVGSWIDEVRQTTEVERSGHRRGDKKLLFVSGRAPSSLQMRNDGTGYLCVRITTTSQLNDRKRFMVQVLPDIDVLSANLDKQFMVELFHESSSDEAVPDPSWMSKPLDVMSKINKRQKDEDPLKKVDHYMEMAEETLKRVDQTGVKELGGEKIPGPTVKELLTMCRRIREILGVGNTKRMKNPEITDDLKADIFKPLERAVAGVESIGIMDLTSTSEDKFKVLEKDYLTAEIVDCLMTPDDMFVTLNKSDVSLSNLAAIALTDTVGSELEMPYQHGTSGTEIPPYRSTPSLDINPQPMEFNPHQDGNHSVKQDMNQNMYSSSQGYQILRIPIASHFATDVPGVLQKMESQVNGAVSDGEGAAALTGLISNLSDEQIKELFRKIDANGNGLISIEELKMARNEGILKGSDADLYALLKWMDRFHQDDQIDFEEFKTSLRLLPSSTTLTNLVSGFKIRVHESKQQFPTPHVEQPMLDRQNSDLLIHNPFPEMKRPLEDLEGNTMKKHRSS